MESYGIDRIDEYCIDDWSDSFFPTLYSMDDQESFL